MAAKLGMRLAMATMVMGTCSVASADMMTVYGTNFGMGDDLLFASATFEVTGNTLTVTLANITNAQAEVPSDLLSGVYFDIFGEPALTGVSAIVADGSTVLYRATQPTGGNVGGEYAYRDDITDGGTQANGGQQYGISGSGLNIFGPSDRFDTSMNLQGPPSGSVGGMEYNLVPIVGLSGDANAPLSGPNEFVQHSVVYTFTMSDFDIPEEFGDIPPSAFFISNVGFQYGTSLSDPYLTTCVDCVPPQDPECEDCPPPSIVPEPSTMLLMLSGLGIMAPAIRRRRS